MYQKIGVIGAMEEEIRLLRQQMQEVVVTNKYQFVFYQGQLNQQNIVLVQSGIGKVNASLSVALLVELFNVDFVINTGTAGAVDPGLKVGDLVIAQSLIHHDVDVTAFGYKKGQMAGMPEQYYPDSQAIQITKEVARRQGLEPILAQIASADEFVNNQARIEMIRKEFPVVRAVEMESAAIAQACHVLEKPYLIIRCISDSADEEANMNFDEFLVLAGGISAKIVVELLGKL
ncbi:5'-methylthioadenosine/adenosylhomocysteine nucleosidase [Facklamia lactis]|uniref:5'-methylthioadenosine/adenosylhomocysteine nucleosidase n=1 Tax=Facklamia lactis TaxID=2749967 RepID=UPI0018CD12BF|nr:5'-methylthioadenosine/adenosylhomocysteine nucleosidase [Facklamia lactis]MBG9979655.1 5'-methylthioadenosine/adenosylhomocysteine nucleosidase [Facklamia lactis]